MPLTNEILEIWIIVLSRESLDCEKFAEESPFPEINVMYDAVYEQAKLPFFKT